MNDKIKVGISTCLLGENVRYDGQHKLDRYLRDTLGGYVQWVPVCPEVECGLPVPRPAMRLVGKPEDPRLMTINSKQDLTGRMKKWIAKRLPELEKENLCGYVFKTKSPSSGMRGVKIYTEDGMPSYSGSGLFAKAFMEKFPLLPVEDEGRLHDASLRENFIERIFIFGRWRKLVSGKPRIKDLIVFHSRHKLILMSHSPKHLRELGKLTASANNNNLPRVMDEYVNIMMPALKLLATVKKNVNVLQHIMGYFKKQLTADEKQELLEVIEEYHRELVPLIVPVTLLKHYVRKYNEPYLMEQYYLSPHPAELKLRNHA